MLAETPARTAITRYVGIACFSFLLLMCAVCMFLWPQLFDHPHWGLSAFGGQPITMVPYYLGYTIVIACLAQITRLLWPVRGTWRPLRAIYAVSTMLAGLIAATSYMQGAFLYWSHIYLCLLLVVWVLGAEIWILTRPSTNWLDYLALAVLMLGTVLVNLSGTWVRGGVLGIYAWGEVVWFLGAFACLGRAALRATTR